MPRFSAVGAEGNLLGVESLPPIHQGETSVGVHGQHHRHLVLQQAGRVGSWTLCQEALRLWNWLDHQGISLVAQNLPGSLNVRVDRLSRCCLADHEWRLHMASSCNGENTASIFSPPQRTRSAQISASWSSQGISRSEKPFIWIGAQDSCMPSCLYLSCPSSEEDQEQLSPSNASVS